ncbi:hypothetical protein SLS55_005009 [Diplodia seriata]|uniref:Uncharacterized protein n=1 Tax=Diplodia seriata TaxID=420778 RepID=A0ABR3CL00_9PEZI
MVPTQLNPFPSFRIINHLSIMQFKRLLANTALLSASAVMAQSAPDPNVDVSVFELRAFSNKTAIDGKPIVAKNGFLAVGTTSEANCTGDNAGYDSTTYTQFLIGLTTYNPDGDSQTSKQPDLSADWPGFMHWHTLAAAPDPPHHHPHNHHPD